MSNSSSSSGGGIGFTGALQILFIALKLTHTVKWTWPWVLAPLWISGGLLLIVLIVIGIVLLVRS